MTPNRRSQPAQHANPDEIDRTVRAVLGNGRRGLIERMNDIEDAFFRNEKTGDRGVIERLKRIESFVIRWSAIWSGASFLAGIAAGYLGHLVR